MINDEAKRKKGRPTRHTGAGPAGGSGVSSGRLGLLGRARLDGGAQQPR